MRKKIVLFELNEVPYRVIDDFVARHPKSTLARLLAHSAQYETITPDRTSLSPWKTWPTLHRGVNDEKHLIHDFGQDLAEVDKAYPPLWKLLAKAGIEVGLCGSLHSYPPPQSYEGYAFYLPDTFAAGSECFPSALVRFQDFNLTMARASARNVSRKLPWREALGVLAAAPGLGLKASTLAEIGGQLVAERVQSWKSTRRRSYQSVLAFDVFMKQLEKSRPDFATFFTNHVASSQHRYWAAAFPGDYDDYGYSDDWRETYRDEIDFTMRKADAMLKRLVAFVERHGYQLWIASSMGQAATQALPFETQLYLMEPDKFMARLGLAPGDYERRPAMLPQVNVVVRRVDDFRAALATLRIDGKPLAWREAGGGHFSLDFGHENLHGRVESAEISGVDVPFAELGLVNLEIDDKSGTSAYHVPGGILLIYDPERAAPRGDVRKARSDLSSAETPARPQIQSTEITPALLRHFAARLPAYMPPPPKL